MARVITVPVFVFVLGLLLWFAATSSVMRTLVVSRGSSGLNRLKNVALLGCFRSIARRTGSYAARDRILTFYAPTAIVSSLLMWLLMYFLAYGMMM